MTGFDLVRLGGHGCARRRRSAATELREAVAGLQAGQAGEVAELREEVRQLRELVHACTAGAGFAAAAP